VTVTPKQGISLAPVFRGEKWDGHDFLFWEHEGNKAVRWGDWKLVSRDRGKWELYNMKQDRTELHDLIAEKPDIAERMIAEWERWADQVGVKK